MIYQQKSNYYITNNDDSNYNFDTSSYRNSNSKKHGPSPRFRRRHTRQVHLDKKIKKPQVWLIFFQVISFACHSLFFFWSIFIAHIDKSSLWSVQPVVTYLSKRKEHHAQVILIEKNLMKTCEKKLLYRFFQNLQRNFSVVVWWIVKREECLISTNLLHVCL